MFKIYDFSPGGGGDILDYVIECKSLSKALFITISFTKDKGR